jgi:hypothetical protein
MARSRSTTRSRIDVIQTDQTQRDAGCHAPCHRGRSRVASLRGLAQPRQQDLLAAFQPTQSGSPGALLHRGPLRSVRVTRRDIRLKQALQATRVLRCSRPSVRLTSPRRRDDPAPHPLCVVLVDTSTSDVPVVDHVLRSVHPSQVSNLPLGSSGVGASSSQAHLPTSACFHSRAPGPVSGRLYEKRPG